MAEQEEKWTIYKTTADKVIKEREPTVSQRTEPFEPDHLVKEGYQTQHTQTMPGLTYLHDKLSARVLHTKGGELIYAYCYGHIPMCYVTSSKLEIPINSTHMATPNPIPLNQDIRKTDMDDLHTDMLRLRQEYPRLWRVGNAPDMLEQLWGCYGRRDWHRLAAYAAVQSTDEEVLGWLDNMRSRCGQAAKSQPLTAYFHEELRSNKSRYDEFYRTFDEDVSLAFNFLLVDAGYRCGVIFHRARYCIRPGLFDKIVQEADKNSNIRHASSDGGDMFLIYNLQHSQIVTDDIIHMAFKDPSGAIYGQLSDHLCPGQTKGGSCILFTADNVVFYLETCVTFTNKRVLDRRIVMWKEIGKEVGVNVEMHEVPLMLERDFHEAINQCDTLELYTHRCSVSRRFWGDDFWDLTGYMFLHDAVDTKSMQRLCAEYSLVWKFIILIQQSRLLIRPNMHIPDARKLRRIVANLECKLYSTMTKPYDCDAIGKYYDFLKDVGFTRVLPVIKDSSYLQIQDERKCLFSMLVDLGIAVDKTNALLGRAREMTRRVLEFERMFIATFGFAQFLFARDR